MEYPLFLQERNAIRAIFSYGKETVKTNQLFSGRSRSANKMDILYLP